MKIIILGAHNCESQQARFASILIDDTIAIDAGGVSPSLSFEAQQAIQAILLTHHHYDHIKDIPVIAMNYWLTETTIDIYSTQRTYDTLVAHLVNDKVYPNFFERPEEKPTINHTVIQPHREIQIQGYSVLALPVNHSGPAVGYQITAPDGKTIFYTGDTGSGLEVCWQNVSPQLLIIEVTLSNKHEEWARNSRHLTPALLKEELVSFQKVKGYLPKVVTVHINPFIEEEIGAELKDVASTLNSTIIPGYEGMQIEI